ATASVDPAADRLIQDSIRTHFADATVVSIAHRLDTVAGLDRVVVLADGRAVEVGEPRVLLAKPRGTLGAVFRELAEATGPANFARLIEVAQRHGAAPASEEVEEEEEEEAPEAETTV
ncbi:Multidrug resistance-associated protein 6, partial [Cladochytrium tenue]